MFLYYRMRELVGERAKREERTYSSRVCRRFEFGLLFLLDTGGGEAGQTRRGNKKWLFMTYLWICTMNWESSSNSCIRHLTWLLMLYCSVRSWSKKNWKSGRIKFKGKKENKLLLLFTKKQQILIKFNYVFFIENNN